MLDLYSNIENYLDFMELKNYAANTIRTYEVNLRYFYSYCKNYNLDYKIIKGSDMVEYVISLKKYKASTINLRLSSLKGFYDYLIDIDEVNINPIRRSLYIRHARKKPKPLNSQEEQLFLNFISNKDEHIYIALRLLLESGIRLSELKKLKISNFIEVNHKYYIQIDESKNFTSRIVPLSSDTYNLVLNHAESQVFFGSIFSLTSRAYQYHCDQFAKIYNIKFSIHSLRHTYATKLSQNKTPIQLIQKLLGHKNIATTMYYVEISDQDILDL